MFEWSQEEKDAIPVHSKMWGNRLKILRGGELLKEYGNFENADDSELTGNLDNKNELIKKFHAIR